MPATKKTGSSYRPFTPAVEQAARLLFHLGESRKPRVTLTEICRSLGIHKSKGYSLLNTLGLFGLVEKDPETKSYALGPSLLFLARNMLDRLDLRQIAAPLLETLARETRSAALLGLISGQDVFVVAKNEGDENVGVTIRVGHRFPITHGAHGKAIVTFMDPMEREEILAGESLCFHGAPSRFSMKRLRREMSSCGKTGYASDVGDLSPGISAVSSPVFDHHRKVLGCVILVGTFPEGRVEAFGRKAALTAQRISRGLGVMADPPWKRVPPQIQKASPGGKEA